MLADVESLSRVLSAREREVLFLRFQLGMGPLEVAQVLDEDALWVRQLLHRILRRLRKLMAAREALDDLIDLSGLSLREEN